MNMWRLALVGAKENKAVWSVSQCSWHLVKARIQKSSTS
jgi:hypothetical protein